MAKGSNPCRRRFGHGIDDRLLHAPHELLHLRLDPDAAERGLARPPVVAAEIVHLEQQHRLGRHQRRETLARTVGLRRRDAGDEQQDQSEPTHSFLRFLGILGPRIVPRLLESVARCERADEGVILGRDVVGSKVPLAIT